jgi:predicted NAD/FAD-binding protein
MWVSYYCTNQCQPINTYAFCADYMNHLQHISEQIHGPVLVTLNPPFEPRSNLIVAQSPYEHPVVSAQVCISEQLLISTLT